MQKEGDVQVTDESGALSPEMDSSFQPSSDANKLVPFDVPDDPLLVVLFLGGFETLRTVAVVAGGFVVVVVVVLEVVVELVGGVPVVVEVV